MSQSSPPSTLRSPIVPGYAASKGSPTGRISVMGFMAWGQPAAAIGAVHAHVLISPTSRCSNMRGQAASNVVATSRTKDLNGIPRKFPDTTPREDLRIALGAVPPTRDGKETLSGREEPSTPPRVQRTSQRYTFLARQPNLRISAPFRYPPPSQSTPSDDTLPRLRRFVNPPNRATATRSAGGRGRGRIRGAAAWPGGRRRA